jgi:hypothetical protein
MGEPIGELGGKTWEELEVLEHDAGQLMFPGKLRRRNKSGAVVEVAVRIRIPSPNDHFAARAEARAWMAKPDLKLDPVANKDIFEQLEQLCLLAKAIRRDTAPHPQFAAAEELAAYDQGSIADIQEQVNLFKERLDPRPSVQTEEEAWRKIVAVAKEANIGPLVDTDGRDQEPLVVRMALEACRSPTGQRWLRSFGISIPEPSPSTSSSPS